jgi:hypothetical protein
MPRIEAILTDSTNTRGLGRENDRTKKMHEEMEVQYFFSAHAQATGERLSVIESSERPDFICARSDGTRVGLELVKVTDSIAPALDIFFTIRKEKAKRQSSDWKLTGNTVLVVQLMDCSLTQLKDQFEPGSFALHGFEQIWLADYTGLEAYGNIEILGLYPDRLWEYYPSERGKPYG